MIHKREKKDNWNFIFLAANQDAIKEGGRFGIHSNKALTFKSNREGVENAFKSMSKICYSLSDDSTSEIKFSNKERMKQK